MLLWSPNPTSCFLQNSYIKPPYSDGICTVYIYILYIYMCCLPYGLLQHRTGMIQGNQILLNGMVWSSLAFHHHPLRFNSLGEDDDEAAQLRWFLVGIPMDLTPGLSTFETPLFDIDCMKSGCIYWYNMHFRFINTHSIIIYDISYIDVFTLNILTLLHGCAEYMMVRFWWC